MQAAVAADPDIKDKVWSFVGKYLAGNTEVTTTARWGEQRISDMSESALLSAAAEFVSKSDLLSVYKAIDVEPNKFDLTSRFVAHLLSYLVSLEKKRKRRLPPTVSTVTTDTSDKGSGDSPPAKKASATLDDASENVCLYNLIL